MKIRILATVYKKIDDCHQENSSSYIFFLVSFTNKLNSVSKMTLIRRLKIISFIKGNTNKDMIRCKLSNNPNYLKILNPD